MSDEGDAIFKRLEEDRGAQIEVLTPEVRRRIYIYHLSFSLLAILRWPALMHNNVNDYAGQGCLTEEY